MNEQNVEVKLKIALDGPNKGQIIESNVDLSPAFAEDTLFACGSDYVFYGLARYKKVADNAFCENGPIRELRYIQANE